MCRIDVRPSGARRMIAVYRWKDAISVLMSRCTTVTNRGWAAFRGRLVPADRWQAACRDRHCPKYRGGTARAWLVEREIGLLSVGNLQLVFILPAEIAAVAFENNVVAHGQLSAWPWTRQGRTWTLGPEGAHVWTALPVQGGNRF